MEREGRIILFVSTRQETVDLMKQTAENLSLPYMLNRWIGGTLSNFANIKGTRQKNGNNAKRKKKEEGGQSIRRKRKGVIESGIGEA